MIEMTNCVYIIEHFKRLFKGVRNPVEARKTIEVLFDKSLTNDKIFYEHCDTSDTESVRDFARKVQEKFSAIHVLINNGEYGMLWISTIII